MRLLERLLARLAGHSLGLPSRYKFVRELGAGAEGEVWLAVDEEQQSWVAVKLIPRGAPAWQLEMAGREFRMALTLGSGPCHINVVRPLELVLTSKHLALITEYVPGGSLADYIGGHWLSEDTCRYFFRQLVAAAGFCHSHSVVYRDLKPANVLVTGTNPAFLKLCDFGLADSWVGRPGPMFASLVGTPGYMSFEVMASFFAGAEVLARRSQEAAAAAKAAAAGRGGGSKHKAAAATTAASPPAAAAASATSGSASTATSSAGGAPAAAGPRGMVRVSTAKRLCRAASGLLNKMAAAAGGDDGSDDGEAEVELAPYDGCAADVFSLGVLLVVMLLRVMPWHYDSWASRMPALDAMRRLYKAAVQQRVSWRDATPGADILSEPLLLLLDGMLQPRPELRATLQQVLASEWVNQPLPPKLQCAMDVLQEEQQAREAAAAAAACHCSSSSDADSAARLAQLREMLAAAATVAKGYKLQSRIILNGQRRRH